jgi:hypothetical protein
MRKISSTMILGLFLLAGCNGGGSVPTVTIGEIACARADITVSGTATSSQVTPPPGSQHQIDVTVTVKCKDTGVEGAQISVEYWWGAVASEVTDSNGEATFPRIGVNGAIPPEAKVKVKLTPDQGDEFTEEVTVTIN